MERGHSTFSYGNRAPVAVKAETNNDLRREKVERPHLTRALVVVAKAPMPASVKTRLCPPLTSVQAAEFYECLLHDIVTKMEKLRGSDFWIAFAPEGEEYFQRSFMEKRLLAQRGKDLGERLHNIFVDLFRMGYKKIVVADSDSPTVPLSHIEQAYGQLNGKNCDLALGPSSDGGYYLIGLKRPQAELFRQMPWSTDEVMRKTLEQAEKLQLRVALLPPAYDIDVEDDLKRLWNDFRVSRRLRERAPKTYAHMTSLLSHSCSLSQYQERAGGSFYEK